MPHLNRYSLHAIAVFIIIALAVCVPAQLRTNPWVSGLPDARQYEDDSVPVVLIGLSMKPDKEYRERVGIKGGRLKNRSSKIVKAIKLRWLSTTAEDSKKRERIFDQGEMESIDVQIKEGQEREIDLPLPQLNEKLRRWIAEKPLDKGFIITIGVSEVFFEDGSSWKAEAINQTVK